MQRRAQSHGKNERDKKRTKTKQNKWTGRLFIIIIIIIIIRHRD